MFTAYREYAATEQETAKTAVPTLLGGVLAAAAVAMGAGNQKVIVVAAIGVAALMALHGRAVRRRAVARTRLEAILDRKLSERRK